jgi:hypothetical protein
MHRARRRRWPRQGWFARIFRRPREEEFIPEIGFDGAMLHVALIRVDGAIAPNRKRNTSKRSTSSTSAWPSATTRSTSGNRPMTRRRLLRAARTPSAPSSKAKRRHGTVPRHRPAIPRQPAKLSSQLRRRSAQRKGLARPCETWRGRIGVIGVRLPGRRLAHRHDRYQFTPYQWGC